MIQLNRNYNLPEKAEEEIPIKVVGVGGAGTNVLDRIVLDGLSKADLIAINTDAQSLASSVAAHKVQLGRTVTRGLGAGGDPEVGYDAAYESATEIRGALRDARMIFVCAGLGGGTGSGAAPAVAQVGRELGSLVIGFATLPFSFEGKRRMKQAEEALEQLREQADAVICFENDRMGDMVAPKAGIHQAFAVADATISQCVRSIVGLIQRPGLIQIGFDDLLTALRGPGGRCLFGFGESDSDNRAHDALKAALKSPLMDKGRNLADASHVLVQVAGGPAMTLSEVEILMQELGKHIRDNTQILFGTSVDGRMGNRLSVTLISSTAADGEEPVQKKERPAKMEPVAKIEPAMKKKEVPPPLPPSKWEETEEPSIQIPMEQPVPVEEMMQDEEEEIEVEVEVEVEVEETQEVVADQEIEIEEGREEEVEAKVEAEVAEAEEVEIAAEAPALDFMSETHSIASVPKKPFAEPEPEPVQPLRATLPKRKPLLPKESKPVEEKKVHAKQEVMQFEPVTRGRFEKSEPTIVEGQDLDIPTFLRKNVRVK